MYNPSVINVILSNYFQLKYLWTMMHRFKWVNEKTNTDKDVLNVQSDQYTELSSRISSQLFLNHLRINWLFAVETLWSFWKDYQRRCKNYFPYAIILRNLQSMRFKPSPLENPQEMKMNQKIVRITRRTQELDPR